MKSLGFLCVLLLAACGVDGEPVQPSGGARVSLGGDTNIGLGATIGLRKPAVPVEATP